MHTSLSKGLLSACHIHLCLCLHHPILHVIPAFSIWMQSWQEAQLAYLSLFTGLTTASNHREATAMQSPGHLDRKKEGQTNCSSSTLNNHSSLTSLSGGSLPQVYTLQGSRVTPALLHSQCKVPSPTSETHHSLSLCLLFLLNYTLRCLSSSVLGNLCNSVQMLSEGQVAIKLICCLCCFLVVSCTLGIS